MGIIKIIPDIFKYVAQKTPKVRNDVVLRAKSSIVEQTKLLKDTAIGDKVSNWCSVFSKSSSEKSKRAILQLDDFLHKYEMCDDVFIKEEVRKCIIKNTKTKRSYIQKFIEFLEMPLDAVNTSTGKYSCVLKDSAPNISAKELMKQGRSIECEFEGFMNWAKMDSLGKFCSDYYWNKDVTYHLWTKYYLNNIPKELQKKLLDIHKKYGTKIIASEGAINEISINKIETEFKAWFEASKGKAKYPKVLNINPYEYEFIREGKEKAAGYVTGAHEEKMALIPDFDNGVIRHEMIHVNDKKRIRSCFKKSKITCELENEMRNAGISEHDIEYAGKNLAEKKAVFGQGDMTKYSESTKAKMEKAGLPKYVMKLSPINAKWKDLEKRVTELCGEIQEKLKYTFEQCENNSPKVQENLEKTLNLFSKSKKQVNPNDFSKVFHIENEIEKINMELKELQNNTLYSKETIEHWVHTYKIYITKLISEKQEILSRYR